MYCWPIYVCGKLTRCVVCPFSCIGPDPPAGVSLERLTFQINGVDDNVGELKSITVSWDPVVCMVVSYM